MAYQLLPILLFVCIQWSAAEELKQIVTRKYGCPLNIHCEQHASGQSFCIHGAKEEDFYKVRLDVTLPRRFYRRKVERQTIASSAFLLRAEYLKSIAKYRKWMEYETILLTSHLLSPSVGTKLHTVPMWDLSNIDEYLLRGDVISVDVAGLFGQALGFLHTGVYLGNGKVAHFTCDDRGIYSERIDPLLGFVGGTAGQTLYVIEYLVPHFTPEVTARRAETYVAAGGVMGEYSLLKNNCQHFVTHCAIGEKLPLQVQDDRTSKRVWTLAALCAAGALSSAITGSGSGPAALAAVYSSGSPLTVSSGVLFQFAS